MHSKKKWIKFDWKGRYDLDIQKWLIEKESVKKIKESPTAIIYVRVSDRKQVTDWHWLESQEAKCRDWAKANNVTVLKMFSDEWISWANMQREGIEAAINFLTEQSKQWKPVTYFLCTEISRVSRSESVEETGKMKRSIESTWTEIILTVSWMNVSKKTTQDEFYADLQILLAKNERLQIRDRSVNWTKAKLYAWEWCLPIPAWYERVSHRVNWKKQNEIVKVEPQASIIKEWLELFANWVIGSQAELLTYFNEKSLSSNSHVAKPWNLRASFVSRILDISKLYFYAWYIFCPNYWIMQPIAALHSPIINMITLWNIWDRLNWKWTKKAGIRKDNSEKFPLRWIVYCPECWFPMTAATSTNNQRRKYDYYTCKHIGCTNKANIRAEEMHEAYEKFLDKNTLKWGIVNIIDKLLNESLQEKNNTLSKLTEHYQKEIKEIDREILSISDKIWKLNNQKIIAKLESDWANLADKKDELEMKLKENSISSAEYPLLYDRVRTMLISPITIWKHWSVKLIQLHASVLFWWKIYYKKNEGFRTPHFHSLELHSISILSSKFPYGAGDGTRTRNSLLGRQAL